MQDLRTKIKVNYNSIYNTSYASETYNIRLCMSFCLLHRSITVYSVDYVLLFIYIVSFVDYIHKYVLLLF